MTGVPVIVDGHHLEAELARGLAQRFAGGAAVLVIVVHVEQDAVGFRQRQVPADFRRRLGE